MRDSQNDSLVGYPRTSCFPPISTVVSIHIRATLQRRDALDDGATPLRLTASQTAATRGVVSGIMGAIDIAPTLRFVEPAWVMDEYIVHHCAALMEPGRDL